MRLQQRLGLAILPAILGPLLIIGGISYYQLVRTAEDKTLESIRTAVAQLSVSIEADISAARTSVEFLAIASPITTYVSASDEDAKYGLYQPGVLALLTNYQSAYPSNRDLQILNVDGTVDLSWSREDAEVPAPAVYQLFVAALRNGSSPILSRIVPGQATGKPLLLVGTPLLMAEAQQRPGKLPPALGHLTAVFDLSQATARADALRFGQSGGVLLVNARGLPWRGTARTSVWNPAGSALDLSTGPEQHSLAVSGSDGVERMVSFLAPHPQLRVIGSIERRELRDASLVIVIAVVILVLLAVLAMHRLIYTTVRRVLLAPAQRLIGIARDMAAGNLQVPVNVDSSDELGDLSRALRDLGNNLTESQESVALREAEREYAVEELKGARDRAEAASRSKSEFLARMSHEIRTPMNGVLGMTELLGGTRLDRRQRQYSETIRHSAEALLKIINDILDFSKIEAGKFELDHAPFDLEQVVEEAAELLAERAHGKGVELLCQLPRDLPLAYRGDGMRLRQVLINLVGNAVKFTECGQVVVRVTASGVDTTGRALLRFEVQDTGIGIPADQQAAIFESFSQADGSTTRKYGGTGLGLAISQQLVGLMGGAITVTSKPGEGSTFGFTIPLAREVASVTELRVERLKGSQILVVDDNETNREILREHLQGWQVDVSEAVSGAQALAKLHAAAGRGEPFDLVVLDYQMPGMSGMDVVRAARAAPALRDVRVVLLSSMSRVDEDTDWRAQRVAAALTKPVRRTHLYNALNRVLTDAPSDTQVLRTLDMHGVTDAVRLGLHILLVEDNAVNQAVARGMLEQLGCKVTVAGDGEEGARIFAGGQFDVVLMDCQMPTLDGYGATERIRAYEKSVDWPRTPVVALTANALEGDRQKCLDAGMDDYLSKPFSQEQLRKLLESLGPADDIKPVAAAVAAAERTGPVLDVRALEQIRALQQPGSPDLLAKVIALYLDSTARLTEQIRTALEAGDADGLRLAAHALKSSSGNVGATVLADIAMQLETYGREQQLGAARPLVTQMAEEQQRVVDALRAERAAA
jgi:signal transduction histidine kinase/DNA-binding response OmpR family regulator/HPt (histidine-containing phosphotransfer) domain-containing protein